MELKSLHCPNCGGMVQIPEGKDSFFCTFCGSQIQVDDNSVRLHFNDEAELKELDPIEQKRLIEEQEKAEQEKKRAEQQAIEKKKKRTWLIVVAVWIVIGTIIGSFPENFMNSVLFFCNLIFVPIYLLVTIPNSFFPPDKPPSVGAKIGLFFIFMLGGGGFMILLYGLFETILH